jgi:hypothetical protein
VSCTDLQPLFDAKKRDRDLAKLVDAHSPDCACENGKVSGGECTPVLDEEHLLRIVLAPRDAADTSPPKFEHAFVLPIIGVGFSVLRDDHKTPGEIVRLAQQLANRAAEAVPSSEVVEVIGVIRFQTRLARSRLKAVAANGSTPKRTICVYATPEREHPSHADLLLAVNNFDSRNKQRKEAFSFSGQLESLFIKAVDFENGEIAGIRLAGRKAI